MQPLGGGIVRALGDKQTVGRTIESILPIGTLSFESPRKGLSGEDESASSSKPDWDFPPLWPTDLFVSTAHLIHTSGLITYFDPNPDANAANSFPPTFTLSQIERRAARATGAAWAEDPDVPALVYNLWNVLVRSWNMPIRAATYSRRRSSPLPRWWKAALQLLIIADTACEGLGAPPTEEKSDAWLVNIFQNIYARPIRKAQRINSSGAYKATRRAASLGIDSDPDVACVQPKSRVAEVGCNLRNLSMNVAYLPPTGNVRCHWHQPVRSEIGEDEDQLDILIVPLPYVIEDSWFVPVDDSKPDPEKRPHWGNFRLKQEWLNEPDAVVRSIISEFKRAKRYSENSTINGIIFPEYALTEEIFKNICDQLKEIEPYLEFAVAGSSTNCEGEVGNIVLTAIWKTERGVNPSSDGVKKYILTSRRKHHRWKISRSQNLSYRIDSRLDPGSEWWEDHRIGQRELHFFHYRQTSVFTALICEDLARSDPCHDIIRSIGPNLLFALLMDGPQRSDRWSARYARSLSDDPGTSVLAVTSLGLMERQNNLKLFRKPSRVVAFWCDERTGAQELILRKKSKSILLHLNAEKARDQTIDGRKKNNSWRWTFGKCVSTPSED